MLSHPSGSLLVEETKGNGGELEKTNFERLVTVMALLAAGDRAALFRLHAEFGAPIAAAVRRELHRLNVRVSPDDFSGLVIDAVMAIGECAGGWNSAGGAMPWVWAEHRIRQVVCREVGQFTDSIDGASEKTLEELDLQAAAAPEAVPDSGISELQVLVRLSSTEQLCGLLLAALEDITSERDREILLAYKLQASLGDPSPANTVGAAFGLKPAAVRQVVKRSLDRLRRLAAREPRFRPLADLAFLAGNVATARTA